MKEDLQTIQEILTQLGVEFFLEYGTCLGAYRDGDFLKGDHDIDIGVIGQESLPAVREAVKVAGFRVMEPTLYLSLRRNWPVDIHFYKEQHDCYQCWIKPGKPYLFFPKRFRELSPLSFKGDTYNIPALTEEYLEWLYGDWRDKESRISSVHGWKNRGL